MGCLKLPYQLETTIVDKNQIFVDFNYYNTGVKTCVDYYPGGMQMPNRNGGQNDYRYSFNGMEKDDEVKGQGNSYTTQFRQYDTRLVRWLTIDPLGGKLPWQSPYVAFDNNPVLFNAPLGLAAGLKTGGKGLLV